MLKEKVLLRQIILITFMHRQIQITPLLVGKEIMIIQYYQQKVIILSKSMAYGGME